MATRELTAGGHLGLLVSCAYGHLVASRRETGLKMAREYQHRPEGFEAVAFNDIYSENEEKAREARGQIYFGDALFPERDLECYELERAIQLNEIDLSQEGVHTLNGIVKFRGYEGRMRKIRLVVIFGVASNGNVYQKDVKILEDKYFAKHEEEK